MYQRFWPQFWLLLTWSTAAAQTLALTGLDDPRDPDRGSTADELCAPLSDEPRTTGEARVRHWAFQNLVRPPVPQLRHAERVRTPIDAFVLARLEGKGLNFSVDAAQRTQVRRAYLDLLGIPPTPEEVDEFLADEYPDSYERLLDRLLASPHFGERWGRHWLDVVGYTDTVGFDIDAALVIQSEGKWRYRDYVIRSFNEGKPYDRFVTEQLAGDELIDWRNAPKFTPEIRQLLVATGYLRTAQDYTHEPESNIPLNHFAVLHDTIEIVGSSLLGLTLNCARCHDHKFDPIPQQDYYRMMALFTPAYNPKDWRAVTPYQAGIQDRALPDVSATERAVIERHNSEMDTRVAELNRQLNELRRPYERRLLAAKLEALPEVIRGDTRAAIDTPPEKRNEIQKYLAGKFETALKVSTDEILAALDDSDKAANTRMVEQIVALTNQRRFFDKIQALFDVGPPPATHVLLRGNHETPGPEVEPGFLSVLCDPGGPASINAASSSATSGRRTALAQWLTRSDSAPASLMARVLVNRIWQHLLGEGIVTTPENFGSGGERPTNPELLDWLAIEFMHNGWQIKPLIKLIMSSTVYCQASLPGPQSDPDAETIDPENQLLWRQRMRRLESEVIRDSIIAVSGKLDRQMGGPPVLLEARPDGMIIISEKAPSALAGKWRRSVYLLARHQYHLSMLTVFDQPVLATNCTRRTASAVPLQSLTMMNDGSLFEQAEQFATRVLDGTGTSPVQQIDLAFRIALGRSPSVVELEWCKDLLQRQTELYLAESSPQDASRKALVHLCQTLLNTSEFLYAQ